jgi:ABC-type Fe3+/spermidine/putrescine transport system ATPase subunit
LRGISKRFGERLILDTIDLVVARGEVLVLVGQSGSGKSTLLKVISGIETPDTGQVLLAGQNVTDLPPYRRAVHTVFQNYALFPHLNVADNVAFPLAVAGRPRRERQGLVAEALAWVKLEQHASRPIDTLSGGERQRVALARALVDSPACVLLDEPLSALDPQLRAGTLELLQGIQSRLATTFLFITHDREEALRLGHRIGVLNRGRLEQVGAPEEIYRQPRTAFVAFFLGRINWLVGELHTSAADAAVVIAGQPVAVSYPPGLPPGPVKIGIRPEDVELVPAGRVGQGSLAAHVSRRLFLGDSVLLTVVLADGTALISDHRGAADGFSPGSQVNVTWKPGAEHLFAVDAEEAAR